MSHSDRTARRYQREGASARAAGRPIESCPYHSRRSAREAWESGWRAAEDDDAVHRPRHDVADSPAMRSTRIDY